MEMAEAVRALGALAHESRLAVFRLLVRQGPGGLPAGQVGEALGLPPATLSFHLAQLDRAGLVRAKRQGRQVLYSADYEAMGGLLGFLTEKCCQPPVRPVRPRAKRESLRRSVRAGG